MSEYITPATKVTEQGGRRLFSIHSDHAKLKEELRSGEQMVAVMYNGLRTMAVVVTDKSEFDYFYKQYYGGLRLSWDVYAYAAVPV